jgi:hypothetical protein
MAEKRSFIVLCGFAGAGKTTVANVLRDAHGYTIFNFADTLKDVVSTIFGWDRQALDGATAASRAWREHADEWWSARLGVRVTPRSALQHIGTDAIRKHFNDETWVASLERKLAAFTVGPVVIGDARFPNEIEAMQKLGGLVVWIKRGPDPAWVHEAQLMLAKDPVATAAWAQAAEAGERPHISEVAWLGTAFDCIIHNDGSPEDMVRNLIASTQTHPLYQSAN